jgi:hypothetical protein
MRFDPVSKCLLLLLLCAAPVAAQEPELFRGFETSPLRLFLDTDIGVRAELGFIPPSSDFGASFEYPVWRKLEIQGAGSFSPDKKQITHNGYSFGVTGTGILWSFTSVGLLGQVGYGRLWTSQFTEGGPTPAIGAVIRTRYEYPGRLYIRYLFATGCVWATPSNPCQLQSKRLQGPTVRQEFQFRPHIRWGVEAGIYHFCDQSNENDPAIPRTCHWAGTELVFVRFQFPGGKSDGPY